MLSWRVLALYHSSNINQLDKPHITLKNKLNLPPDAVIGQLSGFALVTSTRSPQSLVDHTHEPEF
jgi:hypothetical protein